MQSLTRDQFQVHLQRILDSPDSAVDVLKDLFSQIEAFEPGSALDESMNKWFGHSALIGATSPASLISWLGDANEAVMNWVIEDSINSCMAATGIKTLRSGDFESAQNQISDLYGKLETEVSDSADLVMLVQQFNSNGCIALMDAIEILDAVIRERISVADGLRSLQGMMRIMELYVMGSGSRWPVHQGSVKVFGFEVSARLVAILLKKMILADNVIDAKEMDKYYDFLGSRYSIPPDQAQWIYEAAPVNFDIRQVCHDISSLMQTERVKEVYAGLEEIAMADEHLDNREKQLLNFIRSGLNI